MKSKTLLVLLALGSVVCAQENQRFIPHQNLIDINPSFAGSNDGLRLQAANNLSEYFEVGLGYYVSCDYALKGERSGIAAMFDVNGLSFNGFGRYGTYARFNVAYAHHFKLLNEKLIISPSLLLGYNYNKQPYYLSFYWPAKTAFGYAEAGAGLLINYKGLYIAYSQSRPINGPDDQHYRYPWMRSSFYISQNIRINDKSRLNFSITYQNEITRANYNDYRILLTANALLSKRFILGAGWAPEFDNIATLNLGYRGDSFATQFSLSFPADPLYTRFNIFQLSLSINLRKGDKKTSLVDFERW